MKTRLKRIAQAARANPRRTRAAAFLVLVMLAVGAYAAPFVVGDDVRHLSAYDDKARDASAFRETLEGADLRTASAATSPYLLGALDHPDRSALVVLGVERPYAEGEIEDITRFVHAGGTLLLADDTGNARYLAQRFNYTVSGYPVLDEARNHLNDPRFVVATATLDGVDYELLHNAPSQLIHVPGGAEGEVLAQTSRESFLDYDRDGRVGSGSPTGPHTLAVRTTYGSGEVILLSDPGLFMNDVTGVADFDNLAFTRDLIEPLVDEGGVVIFDESRHRAPPAVAATNEAMRGLVLASSTPVWNWIVSLLLVGGVAAAVYATKETEDWRHHTHKLDEVLTAPESVRPDADRVRALALRAVSERYNMSPESVQALSQEEVARLTGDNRIAELVQGNVRGSEATKLLLRFHEPASPARGAAAASDTPSSPRASSTEATP